MHSEKEREPTATDLAAEAAHMAAAGQTKASKGAASVASRDLLAAYMGQLSHIPLYTAAQEITQAQQLEALENKVWEAVLDHPKAASFVLPQAQALEMVAPEPVMLELSQFLEQQIRAAARSRGRSLVVPATWTEQVAHLADVLRAFDRDKLLLDAIIAAVRREVWGRHVMPSNPSLRLTHADLEPIEALRRTSLAARNHFVQANLRLVVSVARGFHHYRIPFIDLIQEGNMGLMKAVHRFDFRRGFRFSTYAHWWIRQSIERAIINKANQVRIPVHVIDARRQVQRISAQLTQSLGRAPTVQEIAEGTELSAERVEHLLSGLQADPISLDERLAGDDGRRIVDTVADDAQPQVDAALMETSTHAALRDLLHKLNPMEQDILARRFGLSGNEDEDQTLDEIGKLYQLSRERVRQIQAQGLAKMRRMCERRDIG